MSDLRTAAQQALEAMLNFPDDISDAMFESITALKAALAQQAEPVQDQRCRAEPRSDGDFVCDCKIGGCPGRSAEPVKPGAWVASKDGRVIYDDASTDDGLLRVSGDFENDEQRSRYAQRIVDKLNAAPAQRKLVPLTEEEIYHATGHCGVSKYTAINIARVIEEASWEKNHGQA